MVTKRASVSLTVIAKNEKDNIDRWYESIKGCFDEIVFCDTGSTDGTVDRAKELGLKVVHFDWCNDFAKARNYALEHATCDYVFWNDLDDELVNKDAFIKWRNNAMHLCDYWLANYHYASDKDGKPVCSFVRERCWKRSTGLQWRYFIHEGVNPVGPHGVAMAQHVSTWAMQHRRTVEDILKDKGRNISIFEHHISKGIELDARMQYYYGKELFEAGQVQKGGEQLIKAAAREELDFHDRILAFQYAATAYQKQEKWVEALKICSTARELDPQRAEFWSMTGDSYAMLKQYQNALINYIAARNCENKGRNINGFVGLIFTAEPAYGPYPTHQIIRCYIHMGRFDEAMEEAKKAVEKYNTDESKQLLDQIEKLQASIDKTKVAPKCDDIVFSCPVGLYEWDSDIAKSRGIGGSEYACVRMAEELSKLGQKVIVFNVRSSEFEDLNGVKYLPMNQAQEYFSNNSPKLHIAWRHNYKLTEAKTFLWSHDLFTPGGEHKDIYSRYLCLSEFHKAYVSSLHGIPEEKIHVVNNGIDAASLKRDTSVVKNPLKFVFGSSPDRGLDKTIRILDRVREKFHVELFVFYGFDNMKKLGLNDKVKMFEDMIAERQWVKLIGNVSRTELLKHYQDASFWLYPTDFLETSCITALESAALGVYPIVRSWGALPYTLEELNKNGMCKILDLEARTESQIDAWADIVCSAISEKAFEKVSFDPNKYDWSIQAKKWLDELPNLK